MSTTSIPFLASDSPIRKVICRVLEFEGYLVVAAGDIGEAVDGLKNSSPALLMIRQYTESISGQDAAVLPRLHPGIPLAKHPVRNGHSSS